VPAQDAPPIVALARLATTAQPSLGRGPARLATDAAAAAACLAAALGAAGEGPLHLRLAASWGLDERAADRVRHAAVLMADHELNPSTFAVRVAASTGASIAAAMVAGLGALSGPLHGGAGAALAVLIEDAARLGAEDAVARWLAHGRPLPGFGHPLYPEGDPRARAMLDGVPPDPAMTALAVAAAQQTGALPNVDFGLAALARALALPGDAPFRLFALGRSIGWAAHAMEQAASGALIRPRARYVGGDAGQDRASGAPAPAPGQHQEPA
jgi:citrate synthase